MKEKNFISGNIKETIINNENVELLDDFFYINEVKPRKKYKTKL